MAGREPSLPDMQRELSKLTTRYTLKRVLGTGSYGVVLKAVDHMDPKHPTVAIKRINSSILDSFGLCERILREIKLLKHFSDLHIVGLQRVLASPTPPLTSLYMVMDIMDTDLHQVFRSKQPLTEQHVQFFFSQLLRALDIVHRAGVIHRDITPANVLVNANCDLKICDFGLARPQEESSDAMTDYVTMRWYRAPELVMEHKHYDAKVDSWSAGLILAEMLGSTPLCQGRNRVAQLDAIVEVTGSPIEEQIGGLGSLAAQRYIRRMKRKPRMDFRAKFPSISAPALDLLEKMLVFHPDQRISVHDALHHPYVAAHAEKWPPLPAVSPFTFDTETLTSITAMGKALMAEATLHKSPSPAPATAQATAHAPPTPNTASATATSSSVPPTTKTANSAPFPTHVPANHVRLRDSDSPHELKEIECEGRSACASVHETTPDEGSYE